MAEQNDQSVLLGKIAAYTEILVKDPKSTIFVSLAETYRKMGMFEDARQIISKGLELHSDFSPAHIVMARIHCQQDDYDASESEFEFALKLDPDSLAGLVGYARLKILLGQDDRARDLLLRARELSPADPVINKLLLSLPEPSAEQPAEQDSKATTPLASATLAELYLKQGMTDEALNVYKGLSAQAPDDLALRRKIKEIENGLVHEPEMDQAEDEPSVETDRQTDDIGLDRLPDADMERTDDLNRSQSSFEERVIDALNQWLEIIQQRRDHV